MVSRLALCSWRFALPSMRSNRENPTHRSYLRNWQYQRGRFECQDYCAKRYKTSVTSEGKNILFEYRYTEGDRDRIPAIVAELINLKVDILFSTQAIVIRAAKQATKTIPIVMADYSGSGRDWAHR